MQSMFENKSVGISQENRLIENPYTRIRRKKKYFFFVKRKEKKGNNKRKDENSTPTKHKNKSGADTPQTQMNKCTQWNMNIENENVSMLCKHYEKKKKIEQHQ